MTGIRLDVRERTSKYLVFLLLLYVLIEYNDQKRKRACVDVYSTIYQSNNHIYVQVIHRSDNISCACLSILKLFFPSWFQ